MNIKTKKERVAYLKAMNLLITGINDENAYMRWIYLVPDGADDDDFEFIAEDNEMYADCCKLFRELIKAYGNSGFVTTGDTVAY